ncbi:hypothetical protein BKA80DRAFT_307040 [Phyllosticta citrichinensis]
MPRARSKTSRTRSLFESSTQELLDSSTFPYGAPPSAPMPAATEVEDEYLTAYAFAGTTPIAPPLTPLPETAETTPRSSTTQSTGVSKCPSAKISNIVRSKSKSKSHHDLEEGEPGAGREDDEKIGRGEWREEMSKERTATNARARRVMGETGSSEAGPRGRQWMDEWWEMLGWRHGASNSTMSNYSGEPKVVVKAKDDDVVSAVDYAMPSDKGQTGGGGGAVVGPFNPARRYSLTSAGNSGGSGNESCKAKEQDDRRRKTFDGRLGAAADEHHGSSITPTTIRTTATRASSSSPSRASTAHDVSPSSPVPHPPEGNKRHVYMADFGLEYGETLHSSASAPQTPQSAPTPKQKESRRRRSDSDSNGKTDLAGFSRHSGVSPFGTDPVPTPVSETSGKAWWKSGSGCGGITKTVDWSVRRGSETSSASKLVRHQDSMRSGGSDWERGAGGTNSATASASASTSGPGGADARASDSHGDVVDPAATSASPTPSPATATRWGLGWMRGDRSRRGGGMTDSLS